MIGRILVLAVLVLSVWVSVGMLRAEPESRMVRVTYYGPTGNPTASGIWPYEGMAACSWEMPLGVWVRIEETLLRCLDRGHLTEPWVDVYCETILCRHWVAGIGPYTDATIEE